jgi:radical SAM protein with 4Fe4S-binding SPASM domain
MLPTQKMTPQFFESIIQQARKYTSQIACHVMGDPLTLPNLKEYLDILGAYEMRAVLTTSGYFLKKHPLEVLFHPAVRQINISLNSYNKNDTTLTLEQYLEPILSLCRNKKENALFINLRLWNLDDILSEKSFNQRLFDILSAYFGVELKSEIIFEMRPKTIRLDEKIILHFENYFEWPSLQNPLYGDGACHGLRSHIAILASGKVVPCCLDCDGVMELGDLHHDTLDEILSNSRAKSIVEGFDKGSAVEELCRHCSYKSRFNAPNEIES